MLGMLARSFPSATRFSAFTLFCQTSITLGKPLESIWKINDFHIDFGHNLIHSIIHFSFFVYFFPTNTESMIDLLEFYNWIYYALSFFILSFIYPPTSWCHVQDSKRNIYVCIWCRNVKRFNCKLNCIILSKIKQLLEMFKGFNQMLNNSGKIFSRQYQWER